MSESWRKRLWVDHDLTRAQTEARELARRAVDVAANRAYDCDDLDSENITELVAFVNEVAKSEQERETNLNARGAAVATVAGLIVTVTGAVAKSVFGIPAWTDWTKSAVVALFLATLFCVAAAMIIAVVAVLRPKRGPRTKNFLGETLVELWIHGQAPKLVRADKDRLRLLALDRSMRTLPEWHFRNRAKARWLRRSWLFLTIGIVLAAFAAVLVLARTLGITPPKTGGAADDLTWGWIGVMIAGTAILAWIALHYDWLGAGRSVRDDPETASYTRELNLIGEKLHESPIGSNHGGASGTLPLNRDETGEIDRNVDNPVVPSNDRVWTLTFSWRRSLRR